MYISCRPMLLFSWNVFDVVVVVDNLPSLTSHSLFGFDYYLSIFDPISVHLFITQLHNPTAKLLVVNWLAVFLTGRDRTLLWRGAT
jgi:hypothetical protein